MFALGKAKMNRQIFKGSFVTLCLYDEGTYIASSQSESGLYLPFQANERLSVMSRPEFFHNV